VTEYINKLQRYLPDQTAELIAQWIVRTNCQFRIAKSRSSRFGDYRHPFRGQGHRISVNHDLNPYAFLITTVHEFAHLKTWNEHQNKVKPHGLEWKSNFKLLMGPFFRRNVFPEDIHQAIQRYLENPAASSCTDLKLFRVLQGYNEPDRKGRVTVEKIANGQHFKWKNGQIFRKVKKIRKRYQCVELSTNKIYLFSPVAEIMPIVEADYSSRIENCSH